MNTCLFIDISPLQQQVQDKFRLDLTDEEAVQYINNVIDVSVSATVAAVWERLHGLAQVRNPILKLNIETS